MRRYLAMAGLDGKTDRLAEVSEVVEQRKPEAILFAGGLGCKGCVDTSQPGFSPKQLDVYAQFLHWAGGQSMPVVVIPGPYDVPLGEFYQWSTNAETDHSHLRVVHATSWRIKDTVFGGIGGAICEHDHCEHPRLQVSRAEAEYFLRNIVRDEAPLHVILLNQPPTGTLGGNSGNTIVSELIDSLHPRLAVTAGETSHRGHEQVARTTIVNPGRLSDGSLAYIDFSRPTEERVEVLDLATRAAV